MHTQSLSLIPILITALALVGCATAGGGPAGPDDGWGDVEAEVFASRIEGSPEADPQASEREEGDGTERTEDDREARSESPCRSILEPYMETLRSDFENIRTSCRNGEQQYAEICDAVRSYKECRRAEREDDRDMMDGGERPSRDGGERTDAGTRPDPEPMPEPDPMPEPGDGSGSGFVSYVGCSQTRDNIGGYAALGGTRLESYATGGGSIEKWSDPNSNYWNLYDQAVAGRTPTAALVQLCVHGSRPSSYADAQAIISILQGKLPAGTPIHVTGLEVFEPLDLCAISGPEAPITSREYADMLVAEGVAQRAPDLGPLTAELTRDGCHPNDAGAAVTGQQLVDYFGK